VQSEGFLLPESIDNLQGNAASIANYLFSSSNIPSPDLMEVLRPLVRLPADEFSNALLELGPQQFGGLTLSNLQTSVRIGSGMNRASTAYETYFSNCYQSLRTAASNIDQSIWFAPIGYYYKQNEMQQQVPFIGRTYGFTAGYNARLFNHLVLSAGVGYTHSSLNWFENRGNANIQSVYLSPSFGYVTDSGYIGVVIVGARSFYDANRKIQFSSVNRKAHNNHKSYDLLTGFTGALKLKILDRVQKDLFLFPIINLTYLNIFESGYRESGAGAINLSIKNVHSAFLRPELKLKLLKQLTTNSFCFSPNIYVGWLKNIPLTKGLFTSRFYKQETAEKNFNVQSYHNSTDQMVLGAEISMVHQNTFSIKMGYEANIGNHYNVQEANITINWTF